ncbi:KH domain-containing protein [Candidatus Saccharibacteria bacterium]|nr:KH domain-containing protein [Candidatus Saccharibacteria bacterium]
MSSIDQQFVEYIVKSVVGNPDAVEINRTVDERGVLLELTVAPEDLGRVIGKRGSGAQAIRTLLRALGTKNDARYNLKIVDNDAPSGGYSKPAPKSEDDSVSNDTEPESTSVEEVEETTETEEEDDNSRAAQTRKELADLDDLDI